MTKAWAIPADMWSGQTVAVIGAAPSLTEAQLARVKKLPCIAANRGILRAPWSEILVAIDGNWPKEAEALPCRLVVGAESDLDAYYVHMPHERVQIAESHTIEIRNNALMGMRMAARGGAAKIVVVGVDPESYDALPHGVMTGLAQAFASLVAELRSQGIEVDVMEGKKQ